MPRKPAPPPDQTDSTGQKLPPVRCPDCNYPLDAASDPTDRAARPNPGDMTVCFQCTTFLEFRADMTLQVASPADVRNLPSDIRDKLFAVRHAIQEFWKAESDAP
jgi:hypothetical protein